MKETINFSNAALRISAGFSNQFPHDVRPQIAFSGRSNVGKSSLINALLGRKSLARVSSAPGKTVTVNFYDIDGKLYFVDLPGYGFAKRPEAEKRKWSALTEGYFVRNPDRDLLALTIQLVDSRIGPTEDDRMMIGFLKDNGIPFLIAASKSDKLTKAEFAASKEKIETEFSGIPVIFFSSLSGLGKDLIKNAIFAAVQNKR